MITLLSQDIHLFPSTFPINPPADDCGEPEQCVRVPPSWGSPSGQSSRVCFSPCSWACTWPFGAGQPAHHSAHQARTLASTPPCTSFLSHLALTDITFSSVTVLKMLMIMQTKRKSIPYAGCVSQTYFFILLADLDSFLITSMAYDRYVAICHPLHYTTIMSQSVCVKLVLDPGSLLVLVLFAHPSPSPPVQALCWQHYPLLLSDLAALLKLSCSDTSLNQLVIFTAGLTAIMLHLYASWFLMAILGPLSSGYPPPRASAKPCPHVALISQ